MHAEAPSRPPVLSDRSPEDLDPLDIAHALSHLCSYAGHVDRMYTVAKRCLHLGNYVALEDALAALLHDVTAAYVVDVSRPLSRAGRDIGGSGAALRSRSPIGHAQNRDSGNRREMGFVEKSEIKHFATK